jgi:hypothetical protein
MDERHSEFAFMDHDRTFTCRVEASHREPAEAWWWFHVSTENHQRHAPCRAEVTDTRRDVQVRVVAYYDNLSRAEQSPPGPAGNAARSRPRQPRRRPARIASHRPRPSGRSWRGVSAADARVQRRTAERLAHAIPNAFEAGEVRRCRLPNLPGGS